MTTRESKSSTENLVRYSLILERLRKFLARRGVIEVVTPVVTRNPSLEPTIDSVRLNEIFYLRTSPESALKQLVAMHGKDVFEIGPVFRARERGSLHLEQFSLLEYYRVGFDCDAMMDELARLLEVLGWTEPVTKMSYHVLFTDVCGFNPYEICTESLYELASKQPIRLTAEESADRGFLFDIVNTHQIARELESFGMVFLYDFPKELRGYARIHKLPTRAARFELYLKGMEIANGYHEITDPEEQRVVFENENRIRRSRGKPEFLLDSGWLSALANGMPDCCGVAVGVERLLCGLLGKEEIRSVVSLPPPAGLPC